MPSLVPGYSYDIFISYRQKDNKYDGWVTEFVSNLRKELEATLKDDVSIYFDQNPHDGLLETNDVDASLSEKLRCLILIPILSQTYCDTKSFAWQKEFLVFNELIKHDSLGPRVTLANGNVSSRILPVRIHDLDAADRSIIEKEIGPLRSIDFIYREPGVNRSLRPTDLKSDNQNKTDYRNQVNKVANAVKELIGGIKQAGTVTSNAGSTSAIEQTPKQKKLLVPALIGAAILVVALGAYFLFSKMSSSGGDFKYDVAVIYLENLTNDEQYSDGLINLIQINLSDDSSIRVAPRHKLYENLKEIDPGSNKLDQSMATELASSLNAKFMITGRVVQQGNEVLAQVELIEVSTGKVVTSKKVRGVKEQIFAVADDITGQLMAGHSLEKEYKVAAISTGNYDAYREYYQGVEHLWDLQFREASARFARAIQLDSTFASAYLYKAFADNTYVGWDVYRNPAETQPLIDMAIKYSTRLPKKDQMMAQLADLTNRKDPRRHEILDQVYALDPNDKLTLIQLLFDRRDDNSIVITEEYLKRNPNQYDAYNSLAYVYADLGYNRKANEAIDAYRNARPDLYNTIHSSWEIALITGESEKARFYGNELIRKFPKNNTRATWLALSNLVDYRPEEALALYNQYIDSTRGREFGLLGMNAYLMRGQTAKAIKIIDALIKRMSKEDEELLAVYFEANKAFTYSFAGRYSEAQKQLDAVIASSVKKLDYNPFPLLGHYQKGVFYLAAGDQQRAAEEVDIIANFVESGDYDKRFDQSVSMLRAEVALESGDLQKTEQILETLTLLDRLKNPNYIRVYTKYLLQAGKYQEAIDVQDKLYHYLNGARSSYGGNQTTMILNYIMRDYVRGVAYQGLSQSGKAKESFTTFLDHLKDADVETAEMKAAQEALKKL